LLLYTGVVDCDFYFTVLC